MRPLILLSLLAMACTAGTDKEDPDTDDTEVVDTVDTVVIDTDVDDTDVVDDSIVTVANCETDIAAGASAFFANYFLCVDVAASGADMTITTDGLPPHQSPYYETTDPNYVAFDTRGGTHNQNPNTLAAGNTSLTIPSSPVAKGITIDTSIVDNEMGTSDEEYSGGPVGVALNGVVIFAAMAAPPDVLADEAFTFDLYEGHPAGTNYHYHFNTPGPLEVLENKGLTTSTVPGEGDIEAYGVMCDGTVVMGCTEFDGSAPSDADFDAQNGHLHDMNDGAGTTILSNRYHTHVCLSEWPDYPFFPEIAYYETTNCPAGPP